jgi:Tfp pilus assembly protein PilF
MNFIVNLKSRVVFSLGRLIICSLSFLIALVVCETALRLYLQRINSQSKNYSTYKWALKEESDYVSNIKKAQIKPDNFNIYYFGESTMKGEPYLDIIPKLVERLLNGKINGKKIFWVNLGEYGSDVAYVKELIDRLFKYKDLTYPSMIVIYSGNNEFLHFGSELGFSAAKKYANITNWIIQKSYIAKLLVQQMKLYKLDIDDRSFFDKPGFSQEQFDYTISNYEQKLSEISKIASSNNIPIIISTVVGNFSDFEPNRSVFCADNSKQYEFKQAMDTGMELVKNSNYQKALDEYQKAISICDKFAETHYRMGKIYQALGDFQKAEEEFTLASDLDKLPMRVLSSQNEYIRSLNLNNNTFIVDAHNELKKLTENGLIGYNLMSDGHHPNIRGYELISNLIAKQIFDIFPQNTSLSSVPEEYIHQEFLNDSGELFSQNTSRAEWLIRVATWRYDPKERTDKASEYLDQAEKIIPKTTTVNLDRMLIYYLRKDNKKAWGYYNKALLIDSKKVREFVSEPWIEQVILRAKANQ